MANILIASLGESPIVVTSMVKILQEQKRIEIEKVILLYPQKKHPRQVQGIEDGVDLIRLHCLCKNIEAWGLPFIDANTPEFCHEFLQTFYGVLETADVQGNVVYLSLAGGRKSMSAIMALLAPFYPNIANVYHILDKNEDTDDRNFYTLQELSDYYYAEDPMLSEVMNPPAENVSLIEIPLEYIAHAEELRRVLQHADSDLPVESVKVSLEHLDVEARAFWSGIFQKKKPNTTESLMLRFSQQAYDQYQSVGDNVRKSFLKYFRFMQSPEALKELRHGSFSGEGAMFHFLKLRQTAERPFFYQQGERVILAQLTHKADHSYQELSQKLAEKAYIPSISEYEPEYTLGKLKQTGDILLAAIGKSPMVVTQAYTLFQRQEVNIETVAVVFPQQNGTIVNGVHVLKEVFKTQDVNLIRYGVKLHDVSSREDCETYLQAIVDAIDALQKQHPDSDIKLLLSGGRKGMTALSLFAAQRSHITQVYHTLINDPALEERIEYEGSLEQIQQLGSIQRKASRMFLDEYADHLLESFTLFKIPVIPLIPFNAP